MQAGEARYTAFEGDRRVASGALVDVAREVKAVVDRGVRGTVLVFDDASGRIVDLDLRGTADDVVKRLNAAATPAPPGRGRSAQGRGAVAPTEEPSGESTRRGPGRPRLGVVGREVTLLPRHWEWLAEQPGGASVTLRKLVEQARRANAGKDTVRRARETAYRFMSHMAGNLPGFEEATRALFAGQAQKFEQQTESWPPDLRDHARQLARPSFS